MADRPYRGFLKRADAVGAAISEEVADLAALPTVQLAVLTACCVALLAGVPHDLIGVVLAIVAILLTQMVLNRQQQREDVEHRREEALHAKLDELIKAAGGARDELAGSERLNEREIEELKPANPRS